MIRLSLLVVGVLVLGACADPVTAPEAGDPGARLGGDAVAGADPGADPGAAGGPGGPGDGETSSAGPAPDGDPGPADCPAGVVDAVGATIEAQLAAFARGDFPAALAEASPSFQAGTDPATFRALIEREYPLLLEDASAELEGCAQLRPELSDVVAVIATGDGARTRFVYRLRLEDERWGIEAAARLDPPAATA